MTPMSLRRRRLVVVILPIVMVIGAVVYCFRPSQQLTGWPIQLENLDEIIYKRVSGGPPPLERINMRLTIANTHRAVRGRDGALEDHKVVSHGIAVITVVRASGSSERACTYRRNVSLSELRRVLTLLNAAHLWRLPTELLLGAEPGWRSVSLRAGKPVSLNSFSAETKHVFATSELSAKMDTRLLSERRFRAFRALTDELDVLAAGNAELQASTSLTQ